MLALNLCLQRILPVNRRWIEDAQKTADNLTVNLRMHRRQILQRREPLAGRNNRVVIRDLLIVRIAGLRDILVKPFCKDCIRVFPHSGYCLQTTDILPDLLRDRRGKHTGVRSRIRHKLLLVQFLRDLQRLIRAQLQRPGTDILKLRQVKKQRRILLLRFLLQLSHAGRDRLRL